MATAPSFVWIEMWGTMANGLMAKKKGKENLPGPTRRLIPANGRMTNAAGRGSKAVLGRAFSSKVLGGMINTTGKVFKPCRMETATRATL